MMLYNLLLSTHTMQGLMLAVALFLAVQARNADRKFNESRIIGYSVSRFTTLPIGMTFFMLGSYRDFAGLQHFHSSLHIPCVFHVTARVRCVAESNACSCFDDLFRIHWIRFDFVRSKDCPVVFDW
jgi:hypothetical protein